MNLSFDPLRSGGGVFHSYLSLPGPVHLPGAGSHTARSRERDQVHVHPQGMLGWGRLTETDMFLLKVDPVVSCLQENTGV